MYAGCTSLGSVAFSPVGGPLPEACHSQNATACDDCSRHRSARDQVFRCAGLLGPKSSEPCEDFLLTHTGAPLSGAAAHVREIFGHINPARPQLHERTEVTPRVTPVAGQRSIDVSGYFAYLIEYSGWVRCESSPAAAEGSGWRATAARLVERMT